MNLWRGSVGLAHVQAISPNISPKLGACIPTPPSGTRCGASWGDGQVLGEGEDGLGSPVTVRRHRSKPADIYF